MNRARFLSTALFVALVLSQIAAKAGESPFPRLSNEEAWASLPKSEAGAGGVLPNWARATARALPRTTAAMLDLDRLHRTKSPLGPILRGKMRWVAADANRCEYSRATAAADLRRAGLGEVDLALLKAGPERWAAADRKPLEFARRMTLDAGAVTDAEVAEILEAYGEERLVAMVLLMAYSNFQDRLLLTLDVRLEDGGPLAPIEVRFDKNSPEPPVPERGRPQDHKGPAVPERVDDPLWSGEEFAVLQKGLRAQRENAGRIRVPSYEEMLKKLPADSPRPKSPVRIKWSLVCMGYQPELAAAWSACTRNFGKEADQDRVFEESLFWVVTRTIHCFY
jgi:alkylhydroperoxidase family enzyme